jgi:hypothetical protein
MTVDDLLVIHQITQLKYRYMRAVDTQDWDLLRTVFTANARTWYNSGMLAAEGRDEVVALLSGSCRPTIYSSHIALHPEITLTGPATARGVWRFEDIVHFAQSDPDFVVEAKGGERLIGAGYYYDEYAVEDGDWKIASTGYVRLFQAKEQQPLQAEFEPARGKLAADGVR